MEADHVSPDLGGGGLKVHTAADRLPDDGIGERVGGENQADEGRRNLGRPSPHPRKTRLHVPLGPFRRRPAPGWPETRHADTQIAKGPAPMDA